MFTYALSFNISVPCWHVLGVLPEQWKVRGCNRIQSDLARFLQLDSLPNANHSEIVLSVYFFTCRRYETKVRWYWQRVCSNSAFYVPPVRKTS